MNNIFEKKDKFNGLRLDIDTELTNMLNMFVESTGFDEQDIINTIKEVAKEMNDSKVLKWKNQN